jgi:hypothetical protein
MSEKEIENKVEEEDLEETSDIDEGDLDEAKKASFGDPSEVPDPVAKTAKAPGKSKKQGDASAPAQGSSEKPKTKMALLNAMMQHAGSMRKNDLQSAYDKMLGEDAELEEVVEQEEVEETRIEKITTSDIDVADDIKAIFSDTDISEEFKEKATEIFETAVVAKVNEKLDEVAQLCETEISESTEVFNKELVDKIDSYLEYVVEQWMEDNTLAVEQGIRSEITESFIGGLRELFESHYIDVPEEKVDIVDELASKVEELEGKLNEEIEIGISMKKEREVHQRAFAFAEVSAGLSETQVAKMESLSEAIEYTDSDSYKEKLETVKESYFSGPKEVARSSVSSLDEDPIDNDGEEAIVPTGSMAAYVSNISAQVKE